MPVTKSELIDQLAERLKLERGRAEQLINTVLESMVTALNDGDRIEIRGFGSFEVRHYKGYSGRNPRTGETVNVKPKRLPFFKTGKELRERVNESLQKQEEAKAGKPDSANESSSAHATLQS